MTYGNSMMYRLRVCFNTLNWHFIHAWHHDEKMFLGCLLSLYLKKRYKIKNERELFRTKDDKDINCQNGIERNTTSLSPAFSGEDV